MKKLLICVLAIIPVSCMKVDLEQTFIYSKITVNETNSSYIGTRHKIDSFEDKNKSIEVLKGSRTVYNGGELLCDLTGNLYMVKSEYKVGKIAIKQEGLSCRFEVVEETIKTHNPSDVKTIVHK